MLAPQHEVVLFQGVKPHASRRSLCSLLSMRLFCFNELNLILRRPRSGRLEGWAAIPISVPRGNTMRKLIQLYTWLCAMVLLISASPVHAQNVLWVASN